MKITECTGTYPLYNFLGRDTFHQSPDASLALESGYFPFLVSIPNNAMHYVICTILH